MKLTYKITLLSTLLATSSMVGAEGIQVSGNVGLTTNYLESGSTMTGNSPSLYGTVKGSMYGVYAQVMVHTLQESFFKKFQAEWVPSIGYQTTIGGLSLYTQYDFYRYTGGTLFDGSKASDNNYDEWDIGFGWGGLYGEYSYSVTKPTGGGHDSWLTLGYTYDFGPVYVDGSFNFQRFEPEGKNRMTNFIFKVGHQFNNGLEPYAAVSIGGQDANNEKIDTRVYAGLQYNF